MTKKTTIKKPKKEKKVRVKIFLVCSVCNKPGEDVEAIYCGFCKEQTGTRQTHTLCYDCFVEQGCPAAYIINKVKKSK